MERIVIVGPSGAGKTTLARDLNAKLEIKVFHLDRFFWKRNWERRNRYDRMELLERLALANKQWIIEGSYLESLEPGLMEADTIILLEFPPLVCLWRIIRRHYEYPRFSRRDIPDTNLRSDRQISKMKSRSQTRIGRIRLVPLNADWYERCIDRFTFWHLLKVLIFPLRGRRKVRQTLCNYSHKHIITLRSKKEVKDFLAQLEQDVDIKRNSSHVVTVRRERNLAIRLILTIYYFLARKSARTTTLLSRYSVEYKMDEHSME